MTNQARDGYWKQYYQKNKERIKLESAERYESNKEKIRSRVLKYYRANKTKVRRAQNRYRTTQAGIDGRKVEHRKAYEKDPERIWRLRLKRKYGINERIYNEILESQGGICGICGAFNRHPTRWGNVSDKLVVDHCHSTGKVRGLLCHNCNAGLGHFKDSQVRLTSAIEYIRRHNGG